MIWREYGSKACGLWHLHGEFVNRQRVTEALCPNTFLRAKNEKPTVLPQWVDLMLD